MLAIEPIRVDRVYHWALSQVQERESTDSTWYNSWADMLAKKRNDGHYPDIVTSLKVHGFIRPLNADVHRGHLALSDGHHRVAAALDLGMECVPVYVTDHPIISDDSGYWRLGRPISEAAGYGRIDSEEFIS